MFVHSRWESARTVSRLRHEFSSQSRCCATEHAKHGEPLMRLRPTAEPLREAYRTTAHKRASRDVHILGTRPTSEPPLHCIALLRFPLRLFPVFQPAFLHTLIPFPSVPSTRARHRPHFSRFSASPRRNNAPSSVNHLPFTLAILFHPV